MIETLEGRTLFAAGGVPGAALIARAEASANPAVQASLVVVKAAVSALGAARDALKADAADTKPVLRDTILDGNERLFAARQAVITARFNDPAAYDAAKAELKTVRAEVRAEIAAARETLGTDTAETKQAVKDAAASLRESLRELRSDLRNSVNASNVPRARQGTGVLSIVDNSLSYSSNAFAGNQPTLDDAALLRYTYYGDVDRGHVSDPNGVVNLDDFSQFLAAFQNGATSGTLAGLLNRGELAD